MKVFADIRQLYIPIQPTLMQSADNVTYEEFLPGLQLQNFIFCYWQLKTNEALSNKFTYRVVSDGCIDIFFDLNNPEENFVMGFCKTYTEFCLENSFNYIGVRFLPTIFPQLFKINAAELSNRFEPLQFVIPSTAKFIAEHVDRNLTIIEIKTLFDKYFSDLIVNTRFDPDSRLYDALHVIMKNGGVINIETDLNTGISPRQLRRLFQFYIGDTAKTFSKVVRFQNMLKAKPSLQSLKQNKLFFDIGYYDQAHFIKEFKNLYGTTPGKAFEK